MRTYEVSEARQTILRRPAWDEIEAPQRLLDGIEAIFGERISPAEVVRHILADVRNRGDAAVVEWTQKIDRIDVPTLVVNQQQLAAAREQLDADTVGS